jgi:hypothetical protein
VAVGLLAGDQPVNGRSNGRAKRGAKIIGLRQFDFAGRHAIKPRLLKMLPVL